MKRYLLIIMILAPLFALSQTEGDMLDFSTIYYQGTAKSAAMGNAMGAVGSDFSAIAINPAGLGLFRKSYSIWTPEFYSISTESTYKGKDGFDRAFKVPMNNLGLSWTQAFNDGVLTSASFALGINKLNNFALDTYAKGDNMNTSLVNAYYSEISFNDIKNENELEAYSPNGLYPLQYTGVFFIDDGDFHTDVPTGGVNQQYGVSKRGTAKEFSLSAGFNFNNKIFLGASLGFPYFDKDVTREYKETNLNTDVFKNWSQSEHIKNSGWGINAKVGVIVYPIKWLRLGAAFHTPSIYSVNESWSTETYSSFTDGNYSYTSPTSSYDYTVTTPLRLNASAALIFGNFGMITGDYDYIDYSTMKASSHDYDYSSLNNFISKFYKATSNIRIGTEWRWQTLAFRAGYAIYGSPYGFDQENLKTTSYSCGLGYTYHDFTIDLAYVLSKRKTSFDLYSQYTLFPAFYMDSNNKLATDETIIKETTNINQVVISFKLRLD